VITLTAGLGLCRGPLAQAADPAEVETLIQQGNDLRKKGRDGAALPLFQRAYDLERTPRTAGQLGTVETAMGYWLSAERHLMEALESPRHPWVARNFPQLEATLREVRANIGELEIVGAPAGAEILINGRSEGITPLSRPLRVGDGTAQITIRAQGFEDQLASVRVTGGKRERLEAALKPAPKGTPKAARASRTGGATGKKSGAAAPPGYIGDATAQAAQPSSVPGWVRPTAWVTGALAVVALGVGVYGYLDMSTNERTFNERRTDDGKVACSTAYENYGGSFCRNLRERALASQKLGLIGLQVGAVLAAGSVVAFLWSASGSEDPIAAADRPGFIAHVAPGELGAGWRLRF
jgi:PEGA domain